jgi:hypothetical protein
MWYLTVWNSRRRLMLDGLSEMGTRYHDRATVREMWWILKFLNWIRRVHKFVPNRTRLSSMTGTAAKISGSDGAPQPSGEVTPQE